MRNQFIQLFVVFSAIGLSALLAFGGTCDPVSPADGFLSAVRRQDFKAAAAVYSRWAAAPDRGHTALSILSLGSFGLSGRERASHRLLVIKVVGDLTKRDLVSTSTPTPLALVAAWDYPELVRHLVSRGAPINQLGPDPHSVCRHTADHGTTALHVAVRARSKSSVAVLLSLGADADLVDSEGRTAVGDALATGDAGLKRLVSRRHRR